MDCVSLKLQST